MILTDEQPAIDLQKLFAEALADVESDVKHPCKTTEHCCEMSGCPRCFQGVMKGDLGVLSVDIFPESRIVRITTVGHEGKPCVVSFRNVPMTIHGSHEESTTKSDNRSSAGCENRACV